MLTLLQALSEYTPTPPQSISFRISPQVSLKLNCSGVLFTWYIKILVFKIRTQKLRHTFQFQHGSLGTNITAHIPK